MQDRIIAVNSNCYHGYPIEEAIRGISAAGFHYIELTATKGWTEHVFPDHSFRSLLRVQDLLDRILLTIYVWRISSEAAILLRQSEKRILRTGQQHRI